MGRLTTTRILFATTLVLMAGGCATPAPKEAPPEPPPVAAPPATPVKPLPPPVKPVPNSTGPAVVAPPPEVAPVAKPPPPGLDSRVKDGIALYNRGRYNDAISALNRKELITDGNTETRITAYKYLAFTYCLSQRTALCRQQFDAIFKIDPKFQLRPVEAGHPLWGPVYKQALGEAQKAGAQR